MFKYSNVDNNEEKFLLPRHFVHCLSEIKVSNPRIRTTLRVYQFLEFALHIFYHQIKN